MCEWRGVDSSSLIHHSKKHSNESARKHSSSDASKQPEVSTRQEPGGANVYKTFFHPPWLRGKSS